MTKSKITDSKAGKEKDVWMDMKTTEYDWYRLSELIKTGVDIFSIIIRYTPKIDQHVVGEEDDCRSNLKKDSKEVVKVIYAAGNKSTFLARDFVQDFGLIKCISSMFGIHNPFLWIPAMDGIEIPIQRNFDFHSVRRTFDFKSVQRTYKFFNSVSVNTKSQGSWERKAKACYTSMVKKKLGANTKLKDTDKRLRATDRPLNASEESDSSKKVKSAEKFNSKEKPKTTGISDAKLESRASDVSDSCNKAKTTAEADSRKRAKAIEDSDAKIESKATVGSEPSRIAKYAEKSDSRKRAKSGEKSSTKQELKVTERKTRSRKEVMMAESEVGKGTDDHEKESSRPGSISKSVRTCMNCGLLEPAPKVFKKCRRCKDEGYPDPPYYCGRDCQVLDWTARHRQQHEMRNAGHPVTS